jgi:hypothetical protein
MTERIVWFTSIKHTQKNNVKFADDSTINAERIGNVSIKRKDGDYSLISDVLNVYGMKCNLLSTGKLLEKNYKVNMEDGMLKVIDAKGNLVLKAPMSKNRTIKIELDVMENKCLLTAPSRDEWLLHYKPGHINFKDLNHM